MKLAKPIPAAALLSLGAFTCWVGSDIFIKLSKEGIDFSQQCLFNRMTAVLVYVLAAYQGRGLRELKTRKPFFHLARGAINCLNMATVYYAINNLPLANFYTIAFTAPFIIAVLSVFILNERPGPKTWIAIITGFIGVIIAIRPERYDAAAWPLLPVLSMVAANLCFAAYALTIKWGGKTESRTALALYPDLMTVTVFFLWVVTTSGMPHDSIAAAFALLSGLFSGLANQMLIAAYRRGANAVVAPMHYSQILTGGLAGYLIWNDVPTPHLLAGATVIIASGLYLIRRAPAE